MMPVTGNPGAYGKITALKHEVGSPGVKETGMDLVNLKLSLG